MSEEETPSSARFLYVEDNESDQLIVSKICKKFMGESPKCFSDGLVYFDYLGQFQEIEQLPKMVLMDLNMPSMNGFEAIEVMKHHDLYKYIPVVVLSSSNDQKDIMRCYEYNVNAYICKKLDFEDYKNNIISTLDFWFNAVHYL